MKNLTKQQRANFVIARGEFSNHAHIIVGDAEVKRNNSGEILITVGKEGAVLKHLLESNWLAGEEKWSNEHTDIDLSGLPKQVRHGDCFLDLVGERTYKFIQQQEFDPYSELIRSVRD